MIIEEHCYPKWMYSADEARIFNSEQELELAEGDWYESPALVPAKPEPKAKKASKQ